MRVEVRICDLLNVIAPNTMVRIICRLSRVSYSGTVSDVKKTKVMLDNARVLQINNRNSVMLDSGKWLEIEVM